MSMPASAPFLVTARDERQDRTGHKAWTTFLDHDTYLPGLVVLARSLQRHRTRFPFVVLVTKRVTSSARDVIRHAGLEMIDIEAVAPGERMAALPTDFGRFAFNWTKLRCWELTQYDRLVFLDSDMLVRANMDELFDVDVPVGYVGACVTCICRTLNRPYLDGWTHDQCGLSRYEDGHPRKITFYSHTAEHLLNSGMMVLRPNKDTAELLAKVLAYDPIVPTLYTCEQDLLAHVFRHRFVNLHWKYNGLKRMFQDHTDIWDPDVVKNIHYILEPKPWQERVKPGDEFEHLHSLWWEAFEELAMAWNGQEALIQNHKYFVPRPLNDAQGS